jgi:hypothetical protein
MRSRANVPLLALLIAAALVAGCGGGVNKGSASSPSSSSSSSTSSSNAGATHGKTNVGGSSSKGGGAGSSGQASDAARLCRQQLEHAPGLSPEVRKSLENTCDKAVRGDTSAVKKATREICVKLAEQNVPAGPARDQTIAACNRAGP